MTFSVALGYFIIFMGVLWAIWPKLLRGWLVGRLSWTIFWPLAGLFFYPSASWAGAKWGTQGWVGAVVLLFLVGSLLRTILNKAAEKLPFFLFRVLSALIILSGLYLVLLKK